MNRLKYDALPSMPAFVRSNFRTWFKGITGLISKKGDRNFLFVNLLHSSILVLRLKRSKTTPYARNVERLAPKTELTLKCTESAAFLSGENITNFAFWLHKK